MKQENGKVENSKNICDSFFEKSFCQNNFSSSLAMPYGPGRTSLLLQPVRAYYVSLFGGLSSVYEPRESAAMSNWQS